MIADPFAAAQAPHQEIARAAASAAFGSKALDDVRLISGGASGASLLRLRVGQGDYLLRVEGPSTPLLRRNRHRYTCAKIAADAGIGPSIHYLNEADGVMIMDFLPSRPLVEFPGGEEALAQELGSLVRRLQSSAAFPQLVYFPDLVTRMLDHLRESEVFAEGLLRGHQQRLDEIREVLDTHASHATPSHNDLNPGNILFDGDRLWLIDWESAYRNHPMVDVSILLDCVTSSPAAQEALLHAWSDGALDAEHREQLSLVRPLARLYYACFLLNTGRLAGGPPEDDLAACQPRDLAAAVLAGNAQRPMWDLGKIWLDGFLTGAPMPSMAKAVCACLGVE